MKYAILLLMILIHAKVMSQNPVVKDQDENIPAGYYIYPIKGENVTASSFETKAHGGFNDFPPQLAIDGDLSNNKGWRAENDGQWIMFDFTKDLKVGMVRIAFMKGEERSYSYSIQVCKNKSEKWETIMDRVKSQKILGFQNIPIPGSLKCRYIKIVGHGNTNSEFKNWININEVQFLCKKKK